MQIDLYRIRLLALTLVFGVSGLCSCRAGANSGTFLSEQFEQGAKRAYAAANVRLASGEWQLDRALIGNTNKDFRNGKASLRMAGGGSATMHFNVRTKAAIISFRYASFGADGPSQVSLWYSTNNGTTWLAAGTRLHVASSSPAIASFPVPASESVRFSIHNDGRTRINIDDINLSLKEAPLTKQNAVPPVNNIQGNCAVAPAEQSATRDDNMALGNPSGATANPTNRDNYLLVRPQYTLSYNANQGIANWVSWQLSTAWRGPARRCNCFLSDHALPRGLFKASPIAYKRTGFSRGHICPSEDRTLTPEDNAATFLMSNVAPQAPLLNQQPWARLEEYARYLAEEGFELYIVAGQYGQGGTGATGRSSAIAAGRIRVPAHYWKIIVVLPVGEDDLRRIGRNTRVIAVDMPNEQSVNEYDWTNFQTSVNRIEAATGYHFFSNLPADIRGALKNKVDELGR